MSLLEQQDSRTGVPQVLLNVARIVFGLTFMQHGAQKLFAVLGREEAVEFLSQLWFAGVLEFWGGLLIVLGLLTRPVAFVLAGEMAWAYFQAHLPRGFFPIENSGERAVLFCFFFLLLAGLGGGRFSLDGLLARRARDPGTTEGGAAA